MNIAFEITSANSSSSKQGVENHATPVEMITQISSDFISPLIWDAKNIQATKIFPSLLQKVTISSELLQEKRFLKIRSWLVTFASQKCKHTKLSLERFLETYLADKGYCHGLCTSLIKLRGEADPEPILKLISRLKKQKSDVVYFQLLDCLRAHFSTDENLDNTQEILKHVSKKAPTIKENKLFSFEDHSLTDVSSFLLKDEILAMVRVWNERKDIGHTLLIVSSETKQEFAFFNSANLALYSYSNQKELVKEFIRHVTSHNHSTNRPGGHWLVELY